ncbi:unnamed protein product [Blepharisma stoltei]|uniref:Uncharacterized protein n=1 Tax=Blepharisma stoltei TaxID=1481888 RepID=A0AAU9JSW8_9CILI|nr:unnamed protein product [Blepharisma stoltei]
MQTPAFSLPIHCIIIIASFLCYCMAKAKRPNIWWVRILSWAPRVAVLDFWENNSIILNVGINLWAVSVRSSISSAPTWFWVYLFRSCIWFIHTSASNCAAPRHLYFSPTDIDTDWITYATWCCIKCLAVFWVWNCSTNVKWPIRSADTVIAASSWQALVVNFAGFIHLGYFGAFIAGLRAKVHIVAVFINSAGIVLSYCFTMPTVTVLAIAIFVFTAREISRQRSITWAINVTFTSRVWDTSSVIPAWTVFKLV